MSDQEAEAQEALAQEAADCESLAQEAEAHEAEAHDALAQLAEFHDAEDHEASDQEALAQDAFAEAVLAQLAASKSLPPVTSVVTNLFSAAFGFGALVSATAFATSTMPTPCESGAAFGVLLAVSYGRATKGASPFAGEAPKFTLGGSAT